MCDYAVRGERQITKSVVAIEKGWEKNVGEVTKTMLFFSFFFAVLCITELSRHAHPLICGFTHNHATFPTKLTSGFHTELPGSQSSPSQKPVHTQGHSRIVGNHFSTKDNLCFQTEMSKRLFKTILRCVKRKKKIASFHLLCVLRQRCERAPLFIIRQNALQDTHKGKAGVLRGERCSGVSHLSLALWGWRKHVMNAEWCYGILFSWWCQW